MVAFDFTTDLFKFNLLGIYNTKREKAFYKVRAYVGGHKHSFSKCNWEKTTQTVWRFNKLPDKIASCQESAIGQHSSIIFKVMRYDLVSRQVDEDYAFAVLPLATVVKGKVYLV
jgi:hypothetical protein